MKWRIEDFYRGSVSNLFLGIYSSYDKLYYSICEPHEHDTHENIDDDLACFFYFFFISATRHELESSIDDIDDTDNSDETKEIPHDVLSKCSKRFFGKESSGKIFCRSDASREITGGSLAVINPRRARTTVPPVTCTSIGHYDRAATKETNYTDARKERHSESTKGTSILSDSSRICKFWSIFPSFIAFFGRIRSEFPFA